jgi:hypothetical protein
MTRFLLAGAAALVTMTGAVMAQSPAPQSAGQTSTQETTTIVSPATAPLTVSSSATAGSAVRADGDQTATRGTSSSDSSGGKTETTITNTSYPLTGMITTTKKTTHVVNGIATETVTITNTYPPSAMIPPQVSTATRTYVVSTQ